MEKRYKVIVVWDSRYAETVEFENIVLVEAFIEAAKNIKLIREIYLQEFKNGKYEFISQRIYGKVISRLYRN